MSTATLTDLAPVAQALVEHLPGRVLEARRHPNPQLLLGALPPAVQATYVGAVSADLAVAFADASALALAGGASSVSAADVLRPALEAAGSVLGSGVLGDSVEGPADTLFGAPDAVVYELHGAEGHVGWFAVVLRAEPVAARVPGAGSVADKLGRISNVEMTLAVEIGRTRMSVKDLLSLQPGEVVELDRSVGAPADVLLNGRLIAHGEIVVVDQEFGVRITEILDTVEGAV